MSIIGSAAGKQLSGYLSNSNSDSFEIKCSEILGDLYENLNHSKRLADIDNSGVDLFIKTDAGQVDKAFQCKGFEKPKFEDSQLRQCCKSIDTFIDSNLSCESYYLVVNRVLLPNYREKLNAYLKKIVACKKSKKAEALDLHDFMVLMTKETIEQLKKKIKQTSKKYYDEYIDLWNQRFYFSEVSFKINNNIKRNPIDYIINIICKDDLHLSNASVDSVRGKYFFIISEFGYGKTSLLLNIFDKNEEKNIIPLYLPVTLFDSESFANTSRMCRKIMDIITENNFESKNIYYRYKCRALQNILDTTPNIILMFDGLDEHEQLYKETYMRHLFDSVNKFKATCIFSMRKSFWDYKKGNIQMSIGKWRRIQDKLILKNWSNADINIFVDLYIEKNKLESIDVNKLVDFKNLVERGDYKEYYGDIPVRPLFLEMLISDIIKGKIQKTNLSQLYEKYFINKYDRDRLGVFESLILERPLNLNEDKWKNINIIFNVLEFAASKMMLRNDLENEVILLSKVDEKEIELFSIENGINNILELLMHSVMVSVDERNLKGLQLKFAHKSFQEYYTARYLFSVFKKNINNDETCIDLEYNYNTSIRKFFKEMINIAILDNQLDKKIVEKYLTKSTSKFSIMRNI